MSEAVELAPYDPHWPSAYTAEAKRLSEALADALCALHHIGSTSVPGLVAKPVIDMLGEAQDLAAIDACAPALADLGYLARGENGIPGRRFFEKRDAAGNRSHHLHVFALGATEIAKHLAFRDRLRADPTLSADYAALKLAILAGGVERREDYQQAKSAFITRACRTQ
ncbi:GrpB family protein [Aurantiacibacter flavus]|uniref:GrpB family protein n=1 Tax=Aurantiacibacter flavus TaxID=3145232 RepID=A0ABV0CT52_9SPHN